MRDGLDGAEPLTCMTRLVPCLAFTVALASCVDLDDPDEMDVDDDLDGEVATTPDQLARRGSCPDVTGPGVEHFGAVTADEVWTPEDNPHRITSDLRILATVTLEPCVQVLLDAGVSIEVGSSSSPGQLIARGGAADDSVRPVNLQATDPAEPWGRLYVSPLGELDLSVAAIQDGGASTTGDLGALVVVGNAAGTNTGEPVASTMVDRVLIERSRSHGLNLAAWGALRDGSEALWIRSCGGEGAEAAVRLEAGVAASLPPDLAVAGNVRDEILMTSSKTFMRDDRLRDLGVPYRQRGVLRVAPGADGAPVTLTIDPGVTLGFEADADSGMVVGTSDARQGILVAAGRADAPIVFTSALDEPAPGDWAAVILAYTPRGETRIEHAMFAFAGGESGHDSFGCGPKDNDAAIIVYGQGTELVSPDPIITETEFDRIGGETVIVSGWIDDDGPDLSEGNRFGAETGACKVSRPRRTGSGDNCDGDRTTCWN